MVISAATDDRARATPENDTILRKREKHGVVFPPLNLYISSLSQLSLNFALVRSFTFAEFLLLINQSGYPYIDCQRLNMAPAMSEAASPIGIANVSLFASIYLGIDIDLADSRRSNSSQIKGRLHSQSRISRHEALT